MAISPIYPGAQTTKPTSTGGTPRSVDGVASNPAMMDRRASASMAPQMSAEDLLNSYNNSWMQTPGSSWDNSQQIRDQYQQQRDQASGRRDTASGDLSRLYTDLAATYEPMAGQTQQRYQQLIGQSAQGSDALVNATTQRINQEAANRAAMYAQMGVGGSGESSLAQNQAQRGLGDIQNTAANWGGLLNAQQGAEVNRNNVDLQGARDQGTLSQEDLTRRYQRFLDELQLQETQALTQPGVSGSSAGSWVNTSGLPDDVLDKLYMQDMYDKGIFQRPQTDFEKFKQEWDYKRNNPMPTAGSGSSFPPLGP